MTPPSPSRRTVHVPVMLHEVLKHLEIQPGHIVVDGTLGAGGHSFHILKAMHSQGRLIGIDRDQSMIDRAAQVVSGPEVSLHQASYAQVEQILDELGIEQVDRVLLDLGLSSDQLADPDRGFGFDTSGPLDMRFDTTVGRPASELLASAHRDELEQIFTEYGEERQAGKIAEAIVNRRKVGRPLQTADQLVSLVEEVTGPSGKAKSPSVTRIFQALRIAVNRELDQLTTFLEDVLPRRLKTGGRVVVITFQSLEDRIVKEAFKDASRWSLPLKKPLSPTASEIRMNPRARSAKLRVAQRINS